jgi:aryl carrier-like protein
MIKDLCDFIKNERIKITEKDVEEEVVKEEVVKEEVVKEEVVKEVVKEEVVKEVVKEEVVEELEINSNLIQEGVVSIIQESVQDLITETNTTVDDMKYIVGKIGTYRMGRYCCIPCNHFCSVKSNLTKHLTTKKHIDKIQNTEVVVGDFKCKFCDKTYKSNQGLWAHNKKCKPIETSVPETVVSDSVYLHKKVENLERIMVEIAKKNNQQINHRHKNPINHQ